ncbi:MAG: acyl-CoA dehydrogenase family protein [Sorangiineae bacterium]|nr:acyl-CoA dehydrogenase family protein [Polyangiaceae bacterium]MEB2321123.1 acyl-CoA dehydrogenase family protein [Sorangiineae bacterium]
MTNRAEQGRAELLAWDEGKPRNFFTSDPNLGRVLALRLGKERYHAERRRLAEVGEMVGTELARLTLETNHDDNLPRLERYSGLGVRTEEVVFHPSYHRAGELIWQTGVLSDYATPGNETLQMGLLHLISQPGENGHNCPLACTAGLIKVVQRLGSDAQRKQWLPGLLERDYAKRVHGSQFLTEVQGGSDVGANAVVARQDGERWRLYGEKWFCSVADAQLFLMTARPEGAIDGTRGLGLFVVPRWVGGRVNEFTLRRLKRKLGTRAMASAEADFDGALGEAVGPVDRGFKNVVEIVLDTSRMYNAVCCAGSMQAAYREAASYARHRRAFGQTIIEFPLVADALSTLHAEAMAATASTLRIIAMADRLATGQGDEALAAAWRVGVNVNKYFTAIRNTQMTRLAIEMLGGNGVIETFTPLVQLYRDAMVLESWEGTHNTLVDQVLRDARRLGIHAMFIAELRDALARLTLPAGDAALVERTRAGIDSVERGFRLVADGVGDQRFGRRIVDRAALCLQLVAMLEELAAFPDDTAKRSAVTLIAERHLAETLEPPPALPPGLV